MRKYTEAEKRKYWMARCPECGWKGLTIDCNGFGSLADTGDYDDGYCPKCSSSIMSDDEQSKRYIIWAWRFLTFWKWREKIKELKWCKKMDKLIESDVFINRGEK